MRLDLSTDQPTAKVMAVAWGEEVSLLLKTTSLLGVQECNKKMIMA